MFSTHLPAGVGAARVGYVDPTELTVYITQQDIFTNVVHQLAPIPKLVHLICIMDEGIELVLHQVMSSGSTSACNSDIIVDLKFDLEGDDDQLHYT